MNNINQEEGSKNIVIGSKKCPQIHLNMFLT